MLVILLRLPSRLLLLLELLLLSVGVGVLGPCGWPSHSSNLMAQEPSSRNDLVSEKMPAKSLCMLSCQTASQDLSMHECNKCTSRMLGVTMRSTIMHAVMAWRVRYSQLGRPD